MKSEKKQQAKDQLKIMKQFEDMSEQFQVKMDKSAEPIKKETAGMIRKASREKSKKEKTLAAKLRLKAKKNK